MTERVTIRTEADARAYLANCGYGSRGDSGVKDIKSLDGVSRGIEHFYVAALRLVERDGVTYVVESAACTRCGGRGYGGWYPDGGVCYECRGANTSARTKSTSLVSWARTARRKEMSDKRRERKLRAKEEADEKALLDGQRRWCAENTPYGAVTFAERDALRDAEREAEKATATYLDVPVKKRVTMELTLDAVFSWEGHYGTTMLYKWKAPCGATVVWKTSAGSSSHWVKDADVGERPPRKGETVTAKFTVKEHSEYRDEKQTAVSRLVVSGLVARKEAA